MKLKLSTIKNKLLGKESNQMNVQILLFAIHEDKTYLLQVDSSNKFLESEKAQQTQLRKMAYDAIMNFYESTKNQLPLDNDDLIKFKLCGIGFNEMSFDLGRVEDLSKKEKVS